MAAERSLETACPAKINLALSVGAPGSVRGGLHPIASWMAALGFADRLTLSKSTDGGSRFHISFLDPPTDVQVDWPLEEDLAYRAHVLLSERAGRPLPVDLSLEKRIPPGSGLAGGSSNAASTLVGLDRLFDLRLGGPVLFDLADQLGSDVAFLVGAALGRPSAVVTEFGRTLETVPMGNCLHIVLMFAPFGCPTGEVYRTFDESRGRSKKVDVLRVRELARVRPIAPDALFNDLADAACRVRPELIKIRDRLRATLDLPVHITGSGSALFVLTAGPDDARAVAHKVTARTGLPAVPTHTL